MVENLVFGGCMGKFIHFVHWVNILMQALFSLLFPVALAVAGAYLLVTYADVGTWIYAVLILVGFASGVVSMVRFILIASRSVEALEKAEKQKQKNRKS